MEEDLIEEFIRLGWHELTRPLNNNEKNDERTILDAPRPRRENEISLRLPNRLFGRRTQAPARYRTEPCLFRSAGWDFCNHLFHR